MAVMHRAESRIGSATSDDADIDEPPGLYMPQEALANDAAQV